MEVVEVLVGDQHSMEVLIIPGIRGRYVSAKVENPFGEERVGQQTDAVDIDADGCVSYELNPIRSFQNTSSSSS